MKVDELLNEVRDRLAASDYVLTEPVFDLVKSLFLLCTADPGLLTAIEQRALEYDREEFFVNCDRNGVAQQTSESLLRQADNVSRQHEGFARWFIRSAVGGKEVLLVGRWLAHLVGLRHISVHMFLDDKPRPGYTWVQVRSLDKADEPGFFDIPVGGHVKGLITPDETLVQEIREELGLRPEEDLDSRRIIGEYNFREDARERHLVEVERRCVFLGRLKESSLPNIRFTDGEVAAICLFSVTELERLLNRCPERVASGLSGSFPAYMKYKRSVRH